MSEPGYVIWRAWRDGMLSQGREVASERMAWETLDQRDRDLDAAIEVEARADALDEESEAFKRLRAVRRQFRHEPSMAGSRWVLPSGDVIAEAIDAILAERQP